MEKAMMFPNNRAVFDKNLKNKTAGIGTLNRIRQKTI